MGKWNLENMEVKRGCGIKKSPTSTKLAFYYQLSDLKQYPPITSSSVGQKSRQAQLGSRLGAHNVKIKVSARLSSHLETHEKNQLQSSFWLLAEYRSLRETEVPVSLLSIGQLLTAVLCSLHMNFSFFKVSNDSLNFSCASYHWLSLLLSPEKIICF